MNLMSLTEKMKHSLPHVRLAVAAGDGNGRTENTQLCDDFLGNPLNLKEEGDHG